MSLSEHLENRKWLLAKLRAEIVGPDPAGSAEQFAPLSPSRYATWKEFGRPRRQMNGEEVIWQDPPAKRYGAGILYPIGVEESAEQARAGQALDMAAGEQSDFSDVDEKLEKRLEKTASKATFELEESDDYAVSLANAHRPSAIGISFIADLSLEAGGFKVEVANTCRFGASDVNICSSGTYRKQTAFIGDSADVSKARTVYLRAPFLDSSGNFPHLVFSTSELLATKSPIRRKLPAGVVDLEVVVVVRSSHAGSGDSVRLVTVSLVNRQSTDGAALDEQCLFQSGLRITGGGDVPWIRPYREAEFGKNGPTDNMSDEYVNRLLYRSSQTFAVGHGCAADWEGSSLQSVHGVWTDVMPAFETPSTSADLVVERPNGEKLAIKASMRKLAGLDSTDDGMAGLEELADAYARWITSLRSTRRSAAAIAVEMSATASGLIERCEICLARIRDGISLLKERSADARVAQDAFRLSNHAMLIAQLRATSEVRSPSVDANGRMMWSPPISNPDSAVSDPERGYWRAFQIAFLLMSLRGIVDPDDKTREVVDLIWFPTGGGKTEAYLGLTAFAIFFNRLSDRSPGGSDVLMRYTLRLLTAQQFQRAALLFCAMEHLRRKRDTLGKKPFLIGLWVGGTTSPNTRKDALIALEDLRRDPDSENPFVLLKCPWCGAKFGPSSSEDLSRRRGGGGHRGRTGGEQTIPKVLGYQRYAESNAHPPTVVFRCADEACEFGTGSTFSALRAPLPIVIIDEDILDRPPNLVIGTVDKFAMLAWKPEARSLFGIGEQGKHTGPPPTLVIQDELHLISGPLGSMVGAYETVVESLCRLNGTGNVKPKIIASTATISRAREQILHLYARDDIFLFPPSGLEADDSFFAREARNEDGTHKPGRLYVGILAPSHGSLQTTEARVFASLMQHAAIMKTDDAGRDPWWTLLCFFNSLRELGSAASLFVADTRDYLRVILDRHGLEYDVIRKLFEVSELTSRIRSDQVPKELERLERKHSTNGDSKSLELGAVDACLASNIIEVGVDVKRLALMAIVGQPKTTAQYIQVSSRIGRDFEKPGLVVVLYGPSKPRDRSHYERFRPYHQKLYAQVEPTSVTPFSPPAVDRALHSVIVAAVLQLGARHTVSSKPDPFPLVEGSALRMLVEEMIEERVAVVAPEERDAVMEKFRKRLLEWRVWQPAEYGNFRPPQQDATLIYPAGSTKPPSWGNKGWPTMSSLRNVDASCEAEVTQFFNQLQGEKS